MITLLATGPNSVYENVRLSLHGKQWLEFVVTIADYTQITQTIQNTKIRAF